MNLKTFLYSFVSLYVPVIAFSLSKSLEALSLKQRSQTSHVNIFGHLTEKKKNLTNKTETQRQANKEIDRQEKRNESV
jgi:hypothetical protein